MKKKCIHIGITLLLMSSIIVSASAQNISGKKLEFEGNNIFKTSELYTQIGVTPTRYVNAESVSARSSRVLELYRSNGYLLVDTTIRESENNIVINISEGPAFIIGKIQINAESEVKWSEIEMKKNATEYEVFAGEKFSSDIIDQLLSKILEFQLNNGYPYAEVSLSEVVFSESEDKKQMITDLIIGIDPKEKMEIEAINIRGLKATDPKIIIRETRIKTPGIYDENKILNSLKYVSNLSFVDSAYLGFVGVDDTGMNIIQINAVERNTNRIGGVVGYIPEQNQTKGYFVGSFELESDNLFGTGRKFNVNWSRNDISSQDLSIKYEEPWIFGMPVNVFTSVDQVIQDSIFTKRSIEIGFKYALNSDITVLGTAGKQEVIADEKGTLIYELEGFKNSYLGMEIVFSKMDDFLNPKNGVYYSTKYSTHKRDVNSGITGSGSNVLDKKITAKFQLAKSIKPKVVAFLNTEWKQTVNSENDIPVSEKWYMGGAKSVRGFREKQFLAAKTAWYNFELRYLLDENARLFVFNDGGVFQDNGKESITKLGYGFGLRVGTRLGLVGFDMGFGKGEPFSEAKLHFIISNSF